MARKLEPIISEFDTQEEADSYDEWFRAKVQAALDEPGTTYTHDEVMARIGEVIKEAAALKTAEPETSVSASKSGRLDPIVSEFETQEQADSYDRWFRAKVEKSLADPRPGVSHDQVMAELDAIIENAIARKKSA